eukprot:gb/GEZN01002396.1/.p1 GENE.gb/GEZN01002396.1/~~gb/GEZN01002396.1/.p1  ORF type:complete len:779 (+),score=124.02 gb/GEZN01002396.1/:51-2387(+)
MSTRLIDQATKDDSQPVNGLLLKQISDETLESLRSCDMIGDYLLRRLKKPSADVKFKALKCIKYIAQNGRAEFRISFQRNKKPIEDLLYFTTNPDPLRGEKPMLAVRTAAKEAMDAVFNSTGRPTKRAAGRMEGYGGGQDNNTVQGFGSNGMGSMGSGGGMGGGISGSGSYGGGGSNGVWSSEAARFASTPTQQMGAGARPDYLGTYQTPTLAREDGTPLPISSGAYSSGRMQGYGNPNFSNQPEQPAGFLAAVSDSVQKTLQSYADPSGVGSGGFNPQRYQGAGPYIGPTGGIDPSSHPHTSAFTQPEAAYAEKKTWKRGAVGGSWNASAGSTSFSGSGGVPAFGPGSHSHTQTSASGAPPMIVPAPGTSDRAPNDGLSPVEDLGEHEKSIINALTEGTGMSKKVDPMELKRFVLQSKAWNQWDMAQYLENRLYEGSPATQLKTLAVIHALIKGSEGEGSTEVEDHFNEHPEALQEIYSNGSRHLKLESQKVMKLCMDDAALNAFIQSIPPQQSQSPARPVASTHKASPPQQQAVAAVAPAQKPAPAPAAQENLFSAFDDTQAAAAVPTGMFAGLDISGTENVAPAAVPAAAQSAFDFIPSEASASVVPPQQQPVVAAAPPQEVNLFDDVFGAAPAPVPSQPAKPKPRDPLAALMAGRPGAAAPASSLFFDQPPTQQPNVNRNYGQQQQPVMGHQQSMMGMGMGMGANIGAPVPASSSMADPFKDLGQSAPTKPANVKGRPNSGFDFIAGNAVTGSPTTGVPNSSDAFAFVGGMMGK